MFAQQHKRRDPAVALLLDALQVFAVELLAPEYRFGFFGGAAELRRVDVRDLETRRQPRELRRRIGARHDDKRNAFGDLLQPLREGGPSLGAYPHLLEIVEDDDAGIRQHGKEVAEETPREASQVLLRLGEHRQRSRRLARDLRRGGAHVMDEGSRVGVAAVRLIPDMRQIARLEVACDQRRLARAGRRRYPDDRARRGFVEEREQARPRQRVVELGPRQFGESGRANGHGCGGRYKRATILPLGQKPRHGLPERIVAAKIVVIRPRPARS